MNDKDLPATITPSAITTREGALYDRITSHLTNARRNIIRSVHTEMLKAYWNIGREIVEEEQKGAARADYGKRILKHLSEQLTRDFGPGYGVSSLRDMRQFYMTYSGSELHSSIHHTVCGEFENYFNSALSWSHYRLLMRIKSPESRSFYEIEAADNCWSVRELERQTSTLLFERLAKSRDKEGVLELAHKGQEILKPADAMKDPLILEFLGIPEAHQLVETGLEEILINNLQHFLLELGKGFAFVARQKRLTLDGDHFYADLVFYHTILKCYIIVDIKTGKLNHGDLGQIQLYTNYFDQEIATEEDNPTLGLVLCTEKNEQMVQYTLGEINKTIFTTKYQFHLPSVEQLEDELNRELRFIKESQNV